LALPNPELPDEQQHMVVATTAEFYKKQSAAPSPQSAVVLR
jgi:hypothetical protein